MNALSSYLRHLIVTGILLLVEKLRLPLDGAEDAANVVALAAIGTAVWAVAKYAPEAAKRIGLLCACLLLFPGCAELPLRLGYYQDGAGAEYSSLEGLALFAFIALACWVFRRHRADTAAIHTLRQWKTAP